jgi:hypothetical protein
VTRLSEAERRLRRLTLERRLLGSLTPSFDPTRTREEVFADEELWAVVNTSIAYTLWDEQEVGDLLYDFGAASLLLAYDALRGAEIEGGMDVAAFLQRIGQAVAERIEQESQP